MFVQYHAKRLPTILPLRVRVENLEEDLYRAQRDAAKAKNKLQKMKKKNNESLAEVEHLRKCLKQMDRKYFAIESD